MKKAKLISANRRQRGYTLVEVVVTITILAILTSIALPSFISTVRNNRIIAQTNELITAFALAKSEASKRGARVSLCGSDGAVCSGGTTWTNGWLVFSDINGDGSLDAGDELLNSFSTDPQTQITTDQVSITYRSAGDITSITNVRISTGGCSSAWQRQIAILASGRAAVSKQDC